MKIGFRLRGACASVVVLFAACALPSCGGAAAQGTAAETPAAGSSASSACVDEAPKDDLCDVLVGHFERCTKSDMPAEHLMDDCRNTWSGFATRANACFTDRLSACLAAPCGEVDTERCFREATVASDPESFAQGADQCVAQGSCKGAPGAWLERCEKRFGECGAFEDVCKTAVSLQRKHRTAVDACLAGGCDGLEDCVYRAVGQ